MAVRREDVVSAPTDNPPYPHLLDVLYFEDLELQDHVTSCFRGVDPRPVLPGEGETPVTPLTSVEPPSRTAPGSSTTIIGPTRSSPLRDRA